MKKYLFFASLLFLCICGLVKVAAGQAADDFDRGVKKVLFEYDEAFDKKDVKTVQRLISTNYIYFSSTGGTTTRKQTLDFLASPKFILKSAKRTEIIGYSSKNAVIVSSR